MSERIDHAAEAREWIDAAAGCPGAVSTEILAQAEATLALVEQQRIANLIALGHLQIASGLNGIGDVVGDGSAFRSLYPEGPNTPLAPAIAAALGIKEGER